MNFARISEYYIDNIIDNIIVIRNHGLSKVIQNLLGFGCWTVTPILGKM